MAHEAAIERPCVKRAGANDWLARKLKWVGRRGAPDRVFIKGIRTVFVEFKDPDEGELSELQKREIAKMRKAGAEVHVIDSIEQFCMVLGIVYVSDT